MKKSKKIFVLVGEESGDIIASDLIQEIKKQNKDKFDLKFYGVTGPRMKSYGVSTIFDFTEINYLGVSEIILNFFSLKIKLNKLIKKIKIINPDLLITVDAKLFSLSLAKGLKKKNVSNNIKLIHVVLPTIWAHSPSRAYKWKKVFDLLVSIIPNEDKYFTNYDVKTVYLGNPIFEKFLNKVTTLKYLKTKNHTKCLILPGSRESEIKYNIDILLKTVLKINYHYKNKIKWLLPTLDRFQKTILHKIKFYNLQHTIEIVNFDKSFQKIAESKVAISCSGTATLQLSLLSIPTIVIYKTSFLNAILGRLFVNIDNVVLPNFISGKKVLPLLFQEKCNTENLFKLFCEFYDNYKIYKKKFQKLSNYLKKEIIRDKNGFNYNLTKTIFNILS
ncbi:MAG: lipid-A-disaccharide synthase [Alphaproteobacteria bacterium]|nr:MAG: lipid-A-disaccharide synthase [Alphaproteobacteria bacterium]